MKTSPTVRIQACVVVCAWAFMAVGAMGQAAEHGNGIGTAPTTKPNVIWILLDACRAGNLSCYGYERRTSPAIDALAGRGVVCEQNFSQANMTPWSVPSYMTGRYFPVYCLDRGSWQALFRARPDKERYISEVLGANGYHTIGITAHAWFSPNSRIWKTFDEFQFVPAEAGHSYAPFERLNTAIFHWIERPHREPFFLYVHALDTHFPHILEAPWTKWLDPEYSSLRVANTALTQRPFSPKEQEHLRGLHDGSIAYADHCLEKLFRKLEELGLTGHTIIVITADHGDLLGEDGQTIDHPSGISSYELFHVPLVMAGPGIPAGRRISALTENVDIVPTLIALLGIQTDAAIDGTSLVPLFEDPAGPPLHPYTIAKRPRGSDDDTPVLMARSIEYHYEMSMEDRAAYLWPMPDRLATRRNVIADHPDIAAAMRAYLTSQAFPLWQGYAALPRTSQTAFTSNLEKNAYPASAWVETSDLEDHKWQLVSGRLKSCAFREDAPPITFRFEAPDGSYRVQLEADAQIGQGANQGSCLAVKADGRTDYMIVETTDTTNKMQFLDIGTYTVTAGIFEITLDEGSRTRWAVASALRFIPLDADVDTGALDDQSKRDEQLRALGYLD